MKVSVVGITEPHHLDEWMETETFYHPNDLLEFAGRNCYLSFNKPNPATREQDDYLSHIISSGHLSVLEHVSLSLYVEGVSRSLLTELERHRHIGLSVVSQRYVGPGKFGYVVPPGLEDDLVMVAMLDAAWDRALILYDYIYEDLRVHKNKPVKEAREAARSVLPGMAETRFVVTANLRAWREIIQKRNDPAADKEIQRFAEQVLNIGIDNFGIVFKDLERNDSR